jgi:CSLREA domain-containing protein
VNTLVDSADGTCGTANCTLRDAIAAANANADLTTITFASGLNGTIQLGSSLTISNPLNLNGPTSQRITIRGNGVGAFSLFIANANAQISNLTLSNSNTVVDNIATLQVSGCTLQGNGSGILNDGTATITNCTLVGNGTGVLALNTTTVQHCTITNNSTGVSNSGGTLHLRNSIVAGNTADVSGTLSTDVFNLKNMTAAEAGLNPAGLANNGGPTQTIGLSRFSPAVDSGDPAFSAGPAFDQRGAGFPRVIGDRVDIGAFEVHEPRLLIALAPGASDTFSEAAGNAATTVRLTRTGDASAPLTVQLVSSNSREARFASSTANFGAGVRTLDIAVNAVDDLFVDGTQDVIVRASAPGFTPQTLTLHVTDNETPPPALTLRLNRTNFYENAANPATTLIIKHNRASTSPVTVTLFTPEARLGVPATVTIPAGTREVRVPISVAEDFGIQGTVAATITGSASGFTGGSATATIWDVQAALTITSTQSTINEAAPGNTTTLRISRNTPTADALLVNLTIVRGMGQATVPVNVTIPAGQSFVDVVATAVNDTAVDGSQMVVVKAGAPGHTASSVRFDVLDNDTSG